MAAGDVLKLQQKRFYKGFVCDSFATGFILSAGGAVTAAN